MEPRRPEEHHGVLDFLAAKTRQRFQVLGQNSQHPAVGAVQKLLVLVGELRTRWLLFITHAISSVGYRTRWTSGINLTDRGVGVPGLCCVQSGNIRSLQVGSSPTRISVVDR